MTASAGTPPADFELRRLSIAAVMGLWDCLAPMVSAVRRKTRADWRVEDVYAELKEGRAVAYLPLVSSSPAGFLVLVDHADPITRRRKLAMWIAYSSNPVVVDKTLDEVERIAREAGFSAVSGMSPRKGWLRRLAPRGYNLVAYCFEKELR
jgi:hypothetical protein